MTSISKEAIDNRVTFFVQSVRSSNTSTSCGFKPNYDWWISHDTKTNKIKHPHAFSFLEQIGVSPDQMISQHGSYWLRDLEEKYPSLQTRQFKKTHCICIRSTDTTTTEITPNDSNIVGGPNTRNASWVKLRGIICGSPDDAICEPPLSKKRKRDVIEDKINMQVKADETPVIVKDLYITDYWHSPEANKLFGTISNKEKNAKESVMNQIALLKDAASSFDGYLKVLSSIDRDDVADLSEYSLYVLRSKITLLILALSISLNKMNSMTWKNCCKEALEQAQTIGITICSNPKTLERYYIEFKANGRVFSMPSITNKHKLPPFLSENPDVVIAIKQYGRENLQGMKTELMAEFIHEKVLPAMVQQAVKIGNSTIDEETLLIYKNACKNEEYEEAKGYLLNQYGLKSITIRTVCRWMKLLGFDYCIRRKTCYVDG